MQIPGSVIRFLVRRHPFSLALCILVLVFFPGLVESQSVSGTRRGTGRTAKTTPELNRSAQESLDRALAALEANSLEEAERAARAAISAAPRSATTHNVLGVVLDRLGRADEAFNEFKVAVKLDSNFLSARNNLGRMFAQRGQTSEAIAQFESILKADPSYVQANYNLGMLYISGGNFAKAADHLGRARAAQPDDPQIGISFVNVAYRSNRTTEAQSVTELLAQKYASEPRILFTLALVVAENKDYQ